MKKLPLVAVYNLSENTYTEYLSLYLSEFQYSTTALCNTIVKKRIHTYAHNKSNTIAIPIDRNPNTIFIDPKTGDYRVWLDIRDSELARTLIHDYLISEIQDQIESLEDRLSTWSIHEHVLTLNLDYAKSKLMVVQSFFNDDLIG